MLIIDELSFTGSPLDARRYFMDQRRYDPWAGTLWHEYCDDHHPTAVPNRVLNHLKNSSLDRVPLKPLPLWNLASLTTCTHLRPPKTWTCPRPRCSWLAKGYALGRRSQPSGRGVSLQVWK